MSTLQSQAIHVGAYMRPARFLVFGAALLLGGCSADLGRFDFPAMGYSGSGAEPKVDRSPPVPVYGNPAYGAPAYDAPAANQRPYATQPYATQPDASPYGSGSATGPGYQPYGAPRGGNTQVARLPDPAPAQGTGPRYEVYSNGVDGGAVDSTRGSSPKGQPRQPAADQGDYRDASDGDSVTVRQGDTLYSIAKQHGTTISDLRTANGLTSSALQVGQKLVIPGKGGRDSGSRTSWNADTAQTPANRRVADAAPLDEPRSGRNSDAGADDTGSDYVVRPGDSLYGIARSLGVRASDLASANGITDPAKLRVGQRLTLPGSSAGNQTTTVIVDDRSDERSEDQEPRRVASLDTNASSGQQDDGYSSSNDASDSASDSAADSTQSEDRVASLPDATGNADDMRFRWPARGRVVKNFGAGSDGKHNDGIDIAVPLGTDVQAAEDGVVAYAGSELKGYGNLILVRHAGDWVTAYAHNEKLLVSRGDKIKRGQVIAKAGRSGSVDRPQLHFELRKGSMPVDPLKYMSSR